MYFKSKNILGNIHNYDIETFRLLKFFTHYQFFERNYRKF